MLNAEVLIAAVAIWVVGIVWGCSCGDNAASGNSES
ncbi:hypothetical protein STSP2_01319 [Anaerohalosphaera lusitana]|uniref:Uncharacterized protein n=1 Tax=Anaerohalosphaera lusitana TaxID=1936003 RepID=A0A1U9NKA0_9BACT|nr:hypothetical protein STSP2_01319 [Anaerohalosphaera lusitana]